MVIAFSSSLSIFHRHLSPHHTLLQPLFPLVLIQSRCHIPFFMVSSLLSCMHHSVSSPVPLPYSFSANLHHSLKVVVPPPPYLHPICTGERRTKSTQQQSYPLPPELLHVSWSCQAQKGCHNKHLHWGAWPNAKAEQYCTLYLSPLKSLLEDTAAEDAD